MHNVAALTKNLAQMPPGAAGIWFAADFRAFPRKSIPNAQSPAAPDPNFLAHPRSSFNTNIWSRSVATATDNNATAPDGSTEASTIVGSTGNWYVYWIRPSDIPAGTYTAAISVRAVSGSADFKLGPLGSGGLKTASSSWQRFSHTFTTGAGPNLAFANSSSVASTFEICDFQLFQGSSDLNVDWATAKPVAIQNAELVVGWTHNEQANIANVINGAFQAGGLGVIQLPAAVTPTNFTLMYLARRSGSRTNASLNMVISSLDSVNGWERFRVGLNGGFGMSVNGTIMHSQQNEDLFVPLGSGPYCAAHRYDGTNIAAFINGTKMFSAAASPSALPIRTLSVGGSNHGHEGDHSIYAIALYPRALTDVEVRQAYLAMKERSPAAKFAMLNNRITVFDGDSITAAGAPNLAYPWLFAQNTPIPCNGWNFAVAGNGISQVAGRAAQVDAIKLLSSASRHILSVDIGTNDLIASPNNTNGLLTPLISYLDARRAAGWKVVIHTLLQRNDAVDLGAQFKIDRDTVNAAIRTWVGVHCDAICDVAADATIGTDSAPNMTVAASATVAVGGTGYSNGAQVLSVAGGASFNVTVSGGVVTAVNSLASPGAYTYATQAANPLATTGGGGSGATLNVTYAGLYFTDKIHPTAAGYAIWQPLIIAAIDGLY